jgi:hypothetical protein
LIPLGPAIAWEKALKHGKPNYRKTYMQENICKKLYFKTLLHWVSIYCISELNILKKNTCVKKAFVGVGI